MTKLTKKEFNRRLVKVSEKMIEAYGNEILLETLDDLEKGGLSKELKSQAEISVVQAASALHNIFGGLDSTVAVMTKTPLVYLDLNMIQSLKKVIRYLSEDRDNRVTTISVLRNVGAYYAYLGYQMCHGITGRNEAFKLIRISIEIYEILQSLVPYVFDDITFEGRTHSAAVALLEDKKRGIGT